MGRVYETLNGIRGIAAIAVAVFHAHGLFGVQTAPGGYLAVDLFFVLSGFVIASAYDQRLASGALTPSRFMLLRVVRFYPLYMLGLLLGAGWTLVAILFAPPAVLTASQWVVSLLLGAFFLPAPFRGDLYQLNVPAWSLLFELLVNGAYALWMRRASSGALATVALLALAALALLLFHDGRGATYGPLVSDVPGAICRTLFSFTMGVLIRRFEAGVPRLPVGALALSILICAPLFVPVPDALRPFVDLALIAVFFPVGIALACRVEPTRSAPLLHALGIASFGLYAIHYPVIQFLLAVKSRTPVPGFLLGAIGIGLLVVAAILIEKHYDRPLRTWIMRVAHPGRPRI